MGLKRKELSTPRGTSEFFPENKFCASLYQKLADMEKASQHDIGFVKRKLLTDAEGLHQRWLQRHCRR